MPRKPLFIIIGLLAIAAGILVPRYLGRSEPEMAQPTPPAPSGGGRGQGNAPLKVYVHEVKPRTLNETISANGTLLANESVDLRSEISGAITEIRLEEGAKVKAGELLVKTNDSELAAQLQRTLFRIELAKSQESRQQQLIERGGTSREAFDEAVNSVRVLEAEADLIRAQLRKTEIRAPFDGVVGLRFVSLGSYLTPSTRIATLQDLDRLKIDFTISERYMGRVHPGTPITFTVAGLPERFTGEVYAVEPAVEVETRSSLLRARAANPERRLLPGAYVSVEVPLDQIKDAILVPTTAIIPGLNQRALFVIENGRAVSREVQTGIRLAREIQIVSGLKAGDQVITSGLLQLRSGMPVEALASE